jgi:hypothetical protein
MFEKYHYEQDPAIMTPTPPKIPSDIGLLLTLGWAIPTWLLAGIFAGRWVDGRLALSPWATLAGASLGMIGAGYTVFRAVRKLDPPS